MRRQRLGALLILGLFVIVANSDAMRPTALSHDEFESMFSASGIAYKGRFVDFTGRLLSDPQTDGRNRYIAVASNAEDSSNIVLALWKELDKPLSENDYVHIRGTVQDIREQKTPSGLAFYIPVIRAEDLAPIDYAAAISPSIRTLHPMQTKQRDGCEVTLLKIELAEDETRLYLRAINRGKTTVSLYDFRTELLQKNITISSQFNYNADYPRLNPELLPGCESTGTMTFGPANPEEGELKISMPIYTGDQGTESDCLEWKITWL